MNNNDNNSGVNQNINIGNNFQEPYAPNQNNVPLFINRGQNQNMPTIDQRPWEAGHIDVNQFGYVHRDDLRRIFASSRGMYHFIKVRGHKHFADRYYLDIKMLTRYLSGDSPLLSIEEVPYMSLP